MEDADDGIWDLEEYSKDLVSEIGGKMHKVNSAVANANLEVRSAVGREDDHDHDYLDEDK